MWRRHFIGIFIFLLIVTGWTISYRSNPNSSHKSLAENFRPYHGEFNRLANIADEDSSVKAVKWDEKHGRSINTKDFDYYTHLKPEHREVLQAWLKTKAYLRPAVEEIDNYIFQEQYKSDFEGNLRFLRESIGVNNNQYYSVGDMNRDGKEDFAVLLVDSRKQKVGKDDIDHFALAIFNAPFKKGNVPAYYEDGLLGISNCYVVFDRVSKRHLFLGQLESDALCATYYPKGKTYYFKDCMD
jgi:hypothetical protein